MNIYLGVGPAGILRLNTEHFNSASRSVKLDGSPLTGYSASSHLTRVTTLDKIACNFCPLVALWWRYFGRQIKMQFAVSIAQFLEGIVGNLYCFVVFHLY